MTMTIDDRDNEHISTARSRWWKADPRARGQNCSGCALSKRSLVVVNGFKEEMSWGGKPPAEQAWLSIGTACSWTQRRAQQSLPHARAAAV